MLEETDYVINNKKTHSVFFGTDLDNLLRILDVDHLVFMGVNTNTCVMNACFDASNLRYTLAVVSDCVDSFYGPDLHEFGLENIRRCLGWVFDSDEMVEKSLFSPGMMVSFTSMTARWKARGLSFSINSFDVTP